MIVNMRMGMAITVNGAFADFMKYSVNLDMKKRKQQEKVGTI